MFTYILIGIIVVCLLAIIFIILRKFPNLAAIDIKSIPSEQQAELKEQILVDRLKRSTGGFFSKLRKKINPVWLATKKFFLKIYQSLLELEKRYQKSAGKISKESGEDSEQKISRLLREAEELEKEEKFSEAEKKYIEIISLDIKNSKAYHALGELYFEGKNYEQAMETFEYFAKLEPENSEAYLHLAETEKALGNYEKSLENAKKAVDLAPNNPRTLAFLLDIAIIVRNKKLAEDTFKKLQKANPENEKLEELKDKIKEI